MEKTSGELPSIDGRWDETVDLLVVGAGAAGLSAAIFGLQSGQETLLCEKTAQVGGTTASSGGIVWAPGNRCAGHRDAGDSSDAARIYMQGEFGAHYHRELADAFLQAAPDAIEALERANVRFSALPWPDYHPERPGGGQGGRSIEAQRFDGRRLGRMFSMVRPPLAPLMLLGGMQVDKRKVDDFLNPFRSPATFFRVMRTLGRYAMDRLSFARGTDLGAGNAMVAAMLHSLLERGGKVWCNSRIVRLVRDADGGRITGAVMQRDGRMVTVRARNGVVLATGGFPGSPEMREELSGEFPHDFTFGFEANVGDGIRAARAAGAALDTDVASSGYWQPCSRIRQADGAFRGVMYGYLDRGRPGVVAVDREGRRFVNEANSYHDVGLALIKAGIARGNYFHFVCDRAFVWHHGLGMIRPYTPGLRRYARMGYIMMADTISELAARIGVDADGLAETIANHNRYARTGRSEEHTSELQSH